MTVPIMKQTEAKKVCHPIAQSQPATREVSGQYVRWARVDVPVQ